MSKTGQVRFPGIPGFFPAVIEDDLGLIELLQSVKFSQESFL
jgi:hypothetical protein